MLDTILVPLDGSSLAERALRYARLLSNHLVLVRAAQARPDPFGELGAAQRAASADAEAYLNRIATTQVRAGRNVHTEVYCGHPHDVIVSATRTHRPQMIVMSTHGRSGLSHLAFGSVAEAILRETDTPVLLIPRTCRRSWTQKHPRVVIALDGSGFAAAAIEPALVLTQSLGASVALLFAVNVTDAFDTESGLEKPFRTHAEEYLQRIANDLRQQGITVATAVQDGEPADVIAATAAHTTTAAVVLASHRRDRLARALLGSVTTSVIHRAEAPVLVARPTATQAAGQPSESFLQAYPLR